MPDLCPGAPGGWMPRFDGVILSPESMAAPWDEVLTAAPRPRAPSRPGYRDRGLRVRNRAACVGSTPRQLRRRGSGRQSRVRRPARRSRAPRPDRDMAGDDRRLLAPRPMAAGGLPVRPAHIDPASHAISAALLPATAWPPAPAGRLRRRAEAPEVRPPPIGFFHIGMAAVQTAEGKPRCVDGTDRTGEFTVAQRVEKADRRPACDFPQHMRETAPTVSKRSRRAMVSRSHSRRGSGTRSSFGRCAST